MPERPGARWGVLAALLVALAEILETFDEVPTISGDVRFSSERHGVVGRDYRVMETQDGELSFVELVAASEVPDIRQSEQGDEE